MGFITSLMVAAVLLHVAAARHQQKRIDLLDCSCLLYNLDTEHVCGEKYDPVTFPGVGTFTADLPCHRRGWPPESPKEIGTEFHLYTSRNRDSPQELVNGGAGTYFDASKGTKVIIHGFRSSAESDWTIEMKDELLKKGDFNVIIVDWKNGANPGFLLPDYCTARQNTRVVARLTANLLKKFYGQYARFIYEDVHIIGHSLGGQTGGYIGQELGGKIGRISGMDPAEPDFQGDEPDCRLDTSDAKFVDVIHTSMFGLFQPVGHVDIYANYGTHQPGCWYVVGDVCAHSRSYKLYTASINNDCSSLAYPCFWTWGQGQGCTYKGHAGVSNVKMGYDADKTPSSAYGIYTIMTTDDSPYCAPNIKPEV